MIKFALAATFAVAMLPSFSTLPANAQEVQLDTPCGDAQCGQDNSSATSQCGDELGHLKRVFPADVLDIDNGYRVWITEICPTSDLMRSDGNAAYLRTAIADNGVLVEALEQKGYFSDDVFAVKMMGDDTIGLYVHHFGR
ncbi:MAG: hypothetical protein JWQ89_4017 [Devosia sp.]|uniref:hypothetical protein n=1 Tax=Devosia sp. TaxID=1871048 RepID=UPI00262B1E45|nr:hypothetical protein [Devosia sp.]MDB5542290.1 hypothetical protein [Devosia sp.]